MVCGISVAVVVPECAGTTTYCYWSGLYHGVPELYRESGCDKGEVHNFAWRGNLAGASPATTPV